MFVYSFKNGENDSTKSSFDKYYMSLVEMKSFIALIDNKSFFDQPIKKKRETIEKRAEIYDYATANLLD